MYSFVELSLKYLSHYLSASNGKGHGIHSPFIFDFIKNVLNDRKMSSVEKKVEDLRRELVKDKTLLTIEDYGAGSSSRSNQRTVGSIARRAVKPEKYARLLYRIAKYYHPQTIVELGTSLGLTTSYLSLSNPSSAVFTLEGSGAIANIAKRHFKTLDLENIRLIEGNFDYTLPSVIDQLSSVDFAFIDGNHRLEPTKNYFRWLSAKAGNDSIFIFDDIHWSKEMEQAWNHILGDPAVTCSIDLFFTGIIFFRKEFIQKQHFKIRF